MMHEAAELVALPALQVRQHLRVFGPDLGCGLGLRPEPMQPQAKAAHQQCHREVSVHLADGVAGRPAAVKTARSATDGSLRQTRARLGTMPMARVGADLAAALRSALGSSRLLPSLCENRTRVRCFCPFSIRPSRFQ